VLTWNVAGHNWARTSTALQYACSDTAQPLPFPSFVGLQELTEPAALMHHDHRHVLIHKHDQDWRSLGIVLDSDRFPHLLTTHPLRGALLCEVKDSAMRKWTLGACHLPHHSTLAATEPLLQEWLGAIPRDSDLVCLACDLNETFSCQDGDVVPHTSRGHLIQQALEVHSLP
jgi:hypothetical protein